MGTSKSYKSQEYRRLVLRIEVARLMLEDSRHSIDVIAREAGFGSRDRMRRAFVRKFGQAPLEIRRDAHAA
jgi:transcriptional regulator GlxA family with amidase domain